jgi:hypothetical protein
MMKIHLSIVSSNIKTGPIPVSTSPADTCPDSCPLKSLCYAKFGPLALHWRKITSGKRGMSWDEFLHDVRRFRRGQLWRHNQAGDLVGKNNSIDRVSLMELVAANEGKMGYTYTHYPVSRHGSCKSTRITRENANLIQEANKKGFTINLSADTLSQADKLFDLEIAPVVTIVPSVNVKNYKTPAGNRVVICPATIHDNVTCATCGICQWKKREYIVGFPSHGIKKKAMNLLVLS